MKLVWSDHYGDRKCMHCRGCIAICPNNALRFKGKGEKEVLIWDKKKCSGCRDCIKVCPEQVLRMV